MPTPTAQDWADLGLWFKRNAEAWGGTRLLLRVVPAWYPQFTSTPPFAEEKENMGSMPAAHPGTVLRVHGASYPLNGPDAGLACQARSPGNGRPRCAVFWYYTSVGWDQFLTAATKAGRMLAEAPPEIRAKIPQPLVDPFEAESDPARWLLTLLCMSYGSFTFAGTLAIPNVVDETHRWHQIPVNRGERDRIARKHPGIVAQAFGSDPVDNFCVVLPDEVYKTSASACLAIAREFPKNPNWEPSPGAPDGESDEQRFDRILQLLSPNARGTAQWKPTPWRSIPGATRADYARLVGEDLVDVGVSVTEDGLDRSGDPEYLAVWLNETGMAVAKARRMSNSTTRPPGEWLVDLLANTPPTSAPESSLALFRSMAETTNSNEQSPVDRVRHSLMESKAGLEDVMLAEAPSRELLDDVLNVLEKAGNGAKGISAHIANAVPNPESFETSMRRALKAAWNHLYSVWAHGRLVDNQFVMRELEVLDGFLSTIASLAEPVAMPSAIPKQADVLAAVFKLDGTVWHVAYEGVSGRFGDTTGMQHIAKLLARPHPAAPIPALELHGTIAEEVDSHRPQEAVDPATLKRLRERRAELVEALDEEQGAYKDHELDSFRRERDDIDDYLRQATGLGGKARRIDGSTAAEKARKAVRNAIDRAINKIAKASPPIPSLVKHLNDAIRAEGDAFAYRPPNPTPAWQL